MAPPWVCFTDLDGTLLDHHDYDWRPAEPALKRLAALGIPVIAISSKTWPELARLRRAIPYLSPLAGCENGALIWDDRGGDDRVEVLGRPLAELVEIFERARRVSGTAGLGFHEVDDARVAAWTGLSLEEAALARRRDASLPVHWPDSAGDRRAFIAAVEAAGARILAGGRFLHLAGQADKSTALRHLMQRLGQGQPLYSLALGDGGNDDAMLAAADIGVRLPPGDGRDRPEPLPDLIRAPEPGPRGWNRAVQALIERQLTQENPP